VAHSQNIQSCWARGFQDPFQVAEIAVVVTPARDMKRINLLLSTQLELMYQGSIVSLFRATSFDQGEMPVGEV
jgi:hypothetical protein